MPCRAHKHWLPRFYAFDCFLGISPTALMRSLHPHRVGEQVTHPTKLPLVTVIPALSLPQVTVTHAPSLPPVIVIPAQAGIHVLVYKRLWIPACAGMTGVRL